jgi:SAM-dependent methyltransferase
MNTITFTDLDSLLCRPEPYAQYTTVEFWNDPHVSQFLLQEHLNPASDLASRNHAFLDRSAEWIINEFGISARSSVLDLGCGPGMYTSRLAKTGAGITGIDASTRSIDYAKEQAAKNGLAVTYRNGNYLDCDYGGPFDLILMIFCDFCVLSPVQRAKLLCKVREALAPGGSFFFDVSSIQYYQNIREKLEIEFQEEGGFWSPERYYAFNQTFKYDDRNLLIDKYTILTGRETRQIHHHLQCYSIEMITHELEENGLTMHKTFSNAAGDKFEEESNEYAIIAVKDPL